MLFFYGFVLSFQAVVETNIKPYLGGVKLCDLSPDDIVHLYNTLATREKNPLCAKSIRNTHGVLHEALDVAVGLDYIRINPTDKKTVVKLPKGVQRDIKPLTDEQVAAFLAELENDSLSAYFKVVLFSGMRESEAIGLTWDCVDFESNSIRVEKQLQKRRISDGGTVFAPLKNNKTRSVTVAPFVMDTLRAERVNQACLKLKAGEAWIGWKSEAERKTALVFTDSLGKCLTPTTVRRHYKLMVEKIGAPESRVHDLRHTFAVLSLQNGDDYKTVQNNLGHATASFTLNVYGHISEKMRNDSASRMQSYIAKIENA